MSFDVLITGKLRGTVKMGSASNGSPFARWQVSASDKSGTSILASCIAFRESVIAAAQALEEGDSLSVSGEAAIKTWQGNDGQTRTGLDVQAHQVLTAYHVSRKRKAMQDDGGEADAPPNKTQSATRTPERHRGGVMADDSAARAFGYGRPGNPHGDGLDDGRPLDF